MSGISERGRLSSAHVVLVVGGIYVTQSTIGAITFHGVPAVLRQAGASLDVIGGISLFMLPWALKFLWAPAVERFRRPQRGGPRSRLLVVVGQGLAIFAVAGLVFTAPVDGFMVLALPLALAGLITATVDIACDGFAIEQLARRNRGWGNTAQVGGGYAGAMLGGGLFLVLVEEAGWNTAIAATVALLVLLTMPMAMTPEPRFALPQVGAHRPSLADALGRPALRWGLATTLLFQAGMRLSQGMIGPFLVDGGFGLAVIGMISGVAGTVASFAGTLLSGWLVARFGAERLLAPLLGAQAVLFGGLTIAAVTGEVSRDVLIMLLLLKAMVVGMSFVALYATMMNWSSLRQAGVDFTLFQCADAAMAAVAGLAGGFLAHNLGYETCFGLASALVVAAAALLPGLLRRSEPEPAA